MAVKSAVVIDNGSGVVKAGLSGDEVPDPKCIQPNIVGVAKHKKCMAGALEATHFVGSNAERYRGLLRLYHPMSHGTVNNWDDMEKVWSQIYANLGVMAGEHGVLMTEAAGTPIKKREEAAEKLFEGFNVPSVLFHNPAVLSLYASGNTTGIVLDSGDGVTQAVPVFEGYGLTHAVTRTNVAGREVTEALMNQLRRSGYGWHTSAEMEVVRTIKEKVCYMAYVPNTEEQLVAKGTCDSAKFTLPDGVSVELGAERFRASEVLFQPGLLGLEYLPIHEVLISSIRKSDIDLRKELYAGMHLAGGNTILQGFPDRLLNEVRKQCKDIKIKIHATPERKYTAWIGGSVFASLAAVRKEWITAEDWREDGRVIASRGCPF